MSGYKIALFLLTISISAIEAQGAESNLYVVRHANCPVFRQMGTQVKPTSVAVFEEGSELRATPHSKNPRYLITQKNNQVFLLDANCLSLKKTEASFFGRQGTWQARVGLISYQTRFTVTDPDQGSFDVITQSEGLCLGGAYHYPLADRLRLHADACLVMGSADARGSGTNENNKLTYQIDRTRALGLRATLGVQLAPESEGIEVGLGIPLLFDLTQWGQANDTIKVDSSALHLLGVVLQLEATRDKYLLFAEFGFLQRFKQSTASLGLGYQW